MLDKLELKKENLGRGQGDKTFFVIVCGGAFLMASQLRGQTDGTRLDTPAELPLLVIPAAGRGGILALTLCGHVHMMSAQVGGRGVPQKLRKGSCVKVVTRGERGGK